MIGSVEMHESLYVEVISLQHLAHHQSVHNITIVQLKHYVVRVHRPSLSKNEIKDVARQDNSQKRLGNIKMSCN